MEIPTIAQLSLLDEAQAAVGLWLVLAAVSPFLRSRLLLLRLVLPLGALGALGLLAVGLGGLQAPPTAVVMPFGLPDLPSHLRLDALSSFFLALLGATAFGVSVFGMGYFDATETGSLSLLCLWYHLFLAGMASVLLADDAYAFMVAWELMAVSSYFLVATDHQIPDIRRAGFLYLLIAHVGAIALLLCFGVLQGGEGAYTFDYMRGARPAPFWASVAFLLALLGFGAKAGLVPMHVWLPEAHPAAPSPVSALMSGVMLKTAIYGLLRVCFDLLGTPATWWGVLALFAGLITALYGVIFAAVQGDMKRLLAYSSIENIGILVTGLGLALLFRADGKGLLAALALAAVLYHAVNHAFFKSLLFLGTGAVLHATGERNLGRLGGLIRSMPWVAWLSLLGVLAIAGLPPLNGFVSEWLLLQAFLQTTGLAQPYLHMLVPVAAGMVALAAALAAYVMVKFYGIVFLGRRRGGGRAVAHDAGIPQRLGMLWLAAGCVFLGLFPNTVVAGLSPVLRLLVGEALQPAGGWLLFVPVNEDQASYAPLVFLVVIVALMLFSFWGPRLVYDIRRRRADPWDCGFPDQTPRMQDTAEGFGQPIRHIFEFFMIVEKEHPDPFDPHPRYRGASLDRIWVGFYRPLGRVVAVLSDLAGRVQHGRIHWYLIYSFVTLLALLAFAR